MAPSPPQAPFPQAAQMAHESMVRNLAAQAEAIWPQEAPLLARHRLPPDARILDAGCGTGEGTVRLAALLPEAELLGVDVLEPHLVRARMRAEAAGLDGRTRFEQRSVLDLGLPAATFDLVACRHVLQATPHPERAVAELVRVTRPGGVVHLIAEDYAMIHFTRGKLDASAMWPAAAQRLVLDRVADAQPEAVPVPEVMMDRLVLIAAEQHRVRHPVLPQPLQVMLQYRLIVDRHHRLRPVRRQRPQPLPFASCED